MDHDELTYQIHIKGGMTYTRNRAQTSAHNLHLHKATNAAVSKCHCLSKR